jgi:pentatricopeptide repeat protein
LYEGWASLFLGQYQVAINILEHLVLITNKHHFAVSPLIVAYCKSGEVQKARPLFGEMRDKCLQQDIGLTGTGIAAAHLQELDEAMELLEKAFTAHDPLLLALKYDYWVPDNLKADPRFQNLLDRIGFPE